MPKVWSTPWQEAARKDATADTTRGAGSSERHASASAPAAPTKATEHAGPALP